MAYKPKSKHRATRARTTRSPSSHQIEREMRLLQRIQGSSQFDSRLARALLETLQWTQTGTRRPDVRPPSEIAKETF